MKNSCLGGTTPANHRRRTCKICKACYAKKRRRTPKGKMEDARWNARVRGTQMERAKAIIYLAVRSNKLPKPWLLLCSCGRRAEVYDHRDYLKPLKVMAVCRSCNKKLGKGKNHGVKKSAKRTIAVPIP